MTEWTFERFTGAGRSAVSVYRCAGLDAAAWQSLAALGCPTRGGDVNRVRLIQFGRTLTEDCVFVRLSGSECEIHTHGGPAAQARVESLFQTAGGRENTELSFEQECWDAVAACQTGRLAKCLARLADGALSKELQRIRKLPDVDRQNALSSLVVASERAMEMIASPVVAILGRPNAGKSSLMNRMAGYERAIVDPRPGATRDAISVETAIDGYPTTLIDTAGLRETNDPVEAEGVRRSLAAAEMAAVRLHVVDQSEPCSETIGPLVTSRDEASTILVKHKSDLPDRSGLDWPAETISVSSVTGDGVTRLLDRIGKVLAERRPEFGTVFLCTERQLDLARQIVNSPDDEILWSRLLCGTTVKTSDHQ